MAKNAAPGPAMFLPPPQVGVTLMDVDPRCLPPVLTLAKHDRDGGDRNFEGLPPRRWEDAPWAKLFSDKG